MIALALAAVALAHCPHDPQLTGGIPYDRGTTPHAITLAICADRRVSGSRGDALSGLSTSPARDKTQWIRVDGKVIFRHRESGPVVLLTVSPDRRWLVFAIDPMAAAAWCTCAAATGSPPT